MYPISRTSGSAVAGAAYRSGSSVVAAAAYRSNGKLKDINGKTHDYSRKSGVIYANILLPKGAPERFKDRQTLWQEVERVEKRKDSRLARQFEASFPPEIGRDDQLKMLEDFIVEHFVSRGMIADYALHDKGNGNAHFHVLLTTRSVTMDGFGKKNRDWDNWGKGDLAVECRDDWAASCNAVFERLGLPDRIDPRSYKDQGLAIEPTKSLGKKQNQLEKKGIKTVRGNINRQIIARNAKRLDMENDRITLFEPSAVEEKGSIQVRPEEVKAAKEVIKRETAIVDDLREIKEIIKEFEQQLIFWKSQGDKKQVTQVAQSMAEVQERLSREYGITGAQIEGVIREKEGHLYWAETILKDHQTTSERVTPAKEEEKSIEQEIEIERE